MRESALWPSLAEYWHPVALSEDVDEGPLAVRLLDERVVVCRLGSGEVRAFHDLCVHRGTPISLGWVEGETIVCAYHGWAYDADGKCIRIPSIPSGHPTPKKACLTHYPAAERYGIIWVCLAEKPRVAHPRRSRARRPKLPHLLPPEKAVAVHGRPGHRKLCGFRSFSMDPRRDSG